MKKSEAGELVMFVIASYPTQRQRMSADDVNAMQAAYAATLEDVEIHAAKAAVVRLLRTSKWIPTIAEILEAVGVVHVGERRHGIDAWGDVLSLHSYRDPDEMESCDPLVIQVCKSFGWIEWRTLFRGHEDVNQWHVMHGENESSDRARFTEAYDKLASAARREAQASPGAIPLPAGRGATAQLESLSEGVARALGGSR